ncbi:hypothetical protein RIF29_16469 [Crotalaria pallida]|uniref:Uncharacterized protein n=1 Tax=Crotalaria pallida TaxID=3830 RepID=A0AAN9FL47_CROPI
MHLVLASHKRFLRLSLGLRVVAVVLLGFAFVVGPLPRPWSSKLVYVVGDIAVELQLRDMRSRTVFI